MASGSAMIARASRAARTDRDGTIFDSLSELRRWRELQLLERAGLIRNLRRQVAFPLVIKGVGPILIRSPRYPNGRAAQYTADFTYEESHEGGLAWREVTEDYKPRWTDEARLRIAVAETIFGMQVRITGGGKLRRKAKTGPLP